MILKHSIEIPKFDIIQQKLQTLLINLFDGANKETIGFIDPKTIKTEIPELQDFFDQNKLNPFCFAVLIRDPHVTAPVHVDGDGKNPVVLALNLPVFNCDNTYMHWFDVPPEQFSFIEDRGNVYRSLPLDYDWTTLELLDSLELTTPHMVRVNVPHNIVNEQNANRAIVSVRFNPTPFHMWPEPISDAYWHEIRR